MSGLELLRDASKVPQDAYEELCDVAVRVLKGHNESSLDPKIEQLSPLVYKQAYAAVVSLLVEFAKVDTDPSIIRYVNFAVDCHCMLSHRPETF